jgi:hypothetical protein
MIINGINDDDVINGINDDGNVIDVFFPFNLMS